MIWLERVNYKSHLPHMHSQTSKTQLLVGLSKDKKNERANLNKKRASSIVLLVNEHDLIFVSKAIKSELKDSVRGPEVISD